MTIDSKIEEIRIVKTEPYEVIIAVLLPMIGLSISFLYNFMGAALAVLGLWIFVKHFLGRSTIITKFLAKSTARLKQITLTPRRETPKNIILLLPKQFYQPEISRGFKKFYHILLYSYTYATGFSILWMYVKIHINRELIFLSVNILLFLVMATYLAVYLKLQSKLHQNSRPLSEKILTKFLNEKEIVNLNILIKPEQDTFSVLRNYSQNQVDFSPSNTRVINIDPLLEPETAIVLEEGVVMVKEYSAFNHLPGLTGTAAVSNKIVLSDLLPFQNQGFSGFTIKAGTNDERGEKLYQIVAQASK